jgi:hypothetical protein
VRLCCQKCFDSKFQPYGCDGNPEVYNSAVLCTAKCYPECDFRADDRCTADWPYMDKESDRGLVTVFMLGNSDFPTLLMHSVEDVLAHIQEMIDDAETDLEEIAEWLKTAKLHDSKGFRMFAVGIHQIPKGLYDRLPEFDGY